MSSNHRMSSNGTQACAACKYQRRKCAPDCILAPYFPSDRQQQFSNAHKLFGVSSITKIIRGLTPEQRDVAMHTIIFQSDMRAHDPVGGCYRLIRDLEHQIECCKAELDLVLHQLAMFRAQEATTLAMINANNVDHKNNNNNVDGGLIVAHRDDHPAVIYDPNCFHGLQLSPPSQDDHRQVNTHDNISSTHDLQFYECWGMQDSSSSTLDGCKGSELSGGQLDADAKPLVDMLSIYGQNCVKFEQTQVDTSCQIDQEFPFVDQQETTQRISLIKKRIRSSSQAIVFKEDNILLEEQHAIPFYNHQDPGHDLRTAATFFTLTS